MRPFHSIIALSIVSFGLAPIILGGDFIYHIGILICIQSLLALSVHLMLRIDQLSLGQAGFMGIGAYASALLTRDLNFSFAFGFLCAIAIPGLIASILGKVILKIKGLHFALLTFVLGEAIVLIFIEFVFPFGGNNGLMNIPAASLFGFSFQDRPQFYGLVIVVLFATFMISTGLLRGESGSVLRGLETNEALVQSLGVGSLAWRRFIFMVSAGVAGAAGSLYAHYFGYISPEAFGIMTTIDAIVMNVVGGVSLLAGPIIGAILLVPLPELFRSAIKYQRLLYGVSLLLLMLFMRQGIGGLFTRKRS